MGTSKMAEKRASLAVGISRKKLKVSKNRKKTWRKTDITDVNEYLEDKRLQERTGGLVSEKADASLFFVDKEKNDVPENLLQKKKKEPKKLKCYSILEPDPLIKPAVVKHDFKTRFQKKLPEDMKRIQNERTLRRIQQSKTDKEEALNSKRDERRKRKQLPVTAYDLWGDENPNLAIPEGDTHYLRVTKKAKIKVPQSVLTKTSG